VLSNSPFFLLRDILARSGPAFSLFSHSTEAHFLVEWLHLFLVTTSRPSPSPLGSNAVRSVMIDLPGNQPRRVPSPSEEFFSFPAELPPAYVTALPTFPKIRHDLPDDGVVVSLSEVKRRMVSSATALCLGRSIAPYVFPPTRQSFSPLRLTIV